MKRTIRNILFYVFCFWVIGVIYVYLSRSILPVAHLIKSIAGFSLIIVASFGAGKKVINWLKLETVTFLEDLSVSIGIGLGLIQVFVLIMGSAGLYKPVYAYLLLLMLIVLTLNNLIDWIKTVVEKWNEHSQNRFSFMGAVFLVILVLGLGIAFISSIAPPVNEYGISGSLATAKRYILHGGLYNIPFNYTSNLPCGMEMLQVLGMLVYGVSVARLLSFGLLMLLAVGVYSMTRKFFHRKIALFATAIVVSTPFIVRLYLINHPFTGSIFFGFMALYSFVGWLGNSQQVEDKNDSWLIVSGIFTAFSLSLGFYTMFTPLVLLIMIFYRLLSTTKDRSPHEIAAKLVCFIFPVVLLLIPVFIRNLLNTGSPFFPFFASSPGKNVELGIESVKSLWGYLFPLWYIPFENEINLKNFYCLGPVYFLFLPGIFLIKDIGKTIGIIIAYVGIYFLIDMAFGRKLIFLYSLIPQVSIIVAYIIINLCGQKKYFYQFVMGVFLFGIGANFYTIWPWINLQKKVDIAIGYTENREYLLKNVRGFTVMEYVNNNTPEDSKIMLVGEKRSFYIDREIISHDAFIAMAENAKTAAQLREKLKKLGVTHLLINTDEVKRPGKYRSYTWNEHVDNLFNILAKKYITLKFRQENYFLYEL